jgi:general stress protein 26
MTTFIDDFDEIRQEFDAFIGSIVYATMVTVDNENRPRTRILIPVWEVVDGVPVGWLATYPTPVKTAHLQRNPHTNFTYWTRGNSSVHIDAVAAWDDSSDTRRHVWDLYARTSPPGAGYPLGRFWTGIDDPSLRMLRLDPWRIQVIRGLDLRSRIWKRTDPEGASSPPTA